MPEVSIDSRYPRISSTGAENLVCVKGTHAGIILSKSSRSADLVAQIEAIDSRKPSN